jgi:hypothetical protein
MRRRLLLLVPIGLSACGETDSARQESAAAAEDRVECAMAGAAAFERRCEVERTSGSEGVVLTLRHPSGSFRRLLITSDGRGVAAADGAEQAVVTPVSDDLIEVAVGGDRFRLPATVR